MISQSLDIDLRSETISPLGRPMKIVEERMSTGERIWSKTSKMSESQLIPGNEYEGCIEKVGPNRLVTVVLENGLRIQARITSRLGLLPGNLEGWRARVLMRRAPRPATVIRVFAADA